MLTIVMHINGGLCMLVNKSNVTITSQIHAVMLPYSYTIDFSSVTTPLAVSKVFIYVVMVVLHVTLVVRKECLRQDLRRFWL